MQVYGSILPGAATVAKLLPSQAAEARHQTTRAKGGIELSSAARHRLEVLRWHEAHGGNVSLTARHFSHSRTSIQAWLRAEARHGRPGLEDKSHRPLNVRQPTWTVEAEDRVLRLREQYPRWGKDKLVVLLGREGIGLSTSMVGRILKRLKDTGRLIEPLPERRRRKREFARPYAIRKPKGYLVKEPGDLVEVDTVDLRPEPGIVLKHFTGRDIVSRWDVLGIYSRATANTASQYLDELMTRTPFTIKAIQVDGGSEFKAQFEAACQERGIPLFVLPPSSPKLNGCVERGNRTHREEFYEVYDLEWTARQLRPDLLNWEVIYNTVRPHQSLGYLTPQEYITQWRSQRPG
jgi:transposase InsO family protein